MAKTAKVGSEEAFFTVSPGARQVRQRKEVKMNQLSPAERNEFLKSMEVEWHTLLQNQAAKVLSLEETTQAQARWLDRAMDTRWARTWKPDDSKPSGRHAKARLIVKRFTDPDLLDIESHSPTHTREGFVTVLQSMCSHGHKLQFGDVQQAFNTGDPIKRTEPSSSGCRLMESQESLVVSGCSCLKQSMDWLMAQESGGTVSLLQPEVWVRDIRLGTVCFGFEEHTTKLSWHRWGGRRRHCWRRRRSLGTSNLQVEATFRFRTLGSGKANILQS